MINMKRVSLQKCVSVIGLGATLLFTSAANAETKIAVIDVVSILQQMPQRETIGKALDAEFEERAKTLQAEDKKANDAAQKLKKDGMTLPVSEKTELENVIKTFESKAKEFSLDYRKRENEEANKLLVKIQEAVKEVVKEDKYDLVLKAEAAFHVADTVDDITNKVLAQVKE